MDVYTVLDYERNVYYYNEEGLYKFLNKGTEDENGMSQDFVVLESFPLPEAYYDDDDGANDEGMDGDNRSYGNYCPFSEDEWTENSVLVFKNGAIFVPEKREHTKTVTVTEYCAPAPKRVRTRSKATVKRRR